MKKIFLTIAFALFSSYANAADTYILDKNHANITWSANHFGFSNPSGKFTKSDGKVILDMENPDKSSVNVTIDTSSVQTGIEKFDNHLKSADFFNVEKFPNASFVSNAVELIGKGRAKVTGSFTLLGVTKPLVLDVKINKIGLNPFTQKKTAGFSAITTIKRSDYGMNFGVPGVSDNVKITIEAEAIIDQTSSVKTSDNSAAPAKNAVSANDFWKINLAESKLEFRAIQDKSSVTGSFAKFDGKILFDPQNLATSKVVIEIDTTSITTSFSDAVTTIQSAAWLASAQYPKATFTSNQFFKIDDKKFRSSGMLNIKGKTVPAILDFTLEEYSTNKARVVGNTTIKRSSFNIGDKDNKKGVKDEVEIKFTINAVR